MKMQLKRFLAVKNIDTNVYEVLRPGEFKHKYGTFASRNDSQKTRVDVRELRPLWNFRNVYYVNENNDIVRNIYKRPVVIVNGEPVKKSENEEVKNV